MEQYPNYFEMELDFNKLPKIDHDHASYADYILCVTRLWCRENNVTYNGLLASLCSAVLQGNIVVEKKDREKLHALQSRESRAERAISTLTPADFLYNLYNKYHVPISDYSEMEFILGHKNYILNKLGGIHISK